jgi:hypothetical protein
MIFFYKPKGNQSNFLNKKYPLILDHPVKYNENGCIKMNFIGFFKIKTDEIIKYSPKISCHGYLFIYQKTKSIGKPQKSCDFRRLLDFLFHKNSFFWPTDL